MSGRLSSGPGQPSESPHLLPTGRAPGVSGAHGRPCWAVVDGAQAQPCLLCPASAPARPELPCVKRQGVDLQGGGPPCALSRPRLVQNKQSVVPELREWEPDKHCPAPPTRQRCYLLPCLFFQSAGRGFLRSLGRRVGAPGPAHSPAGSITEVSYRNDSYKQ